VVVAATSPSRVTEQLSVQQLASRLKEIKVEDLRSVSKARFCKQDSFHYIRTTICKKIVCDFDLGRETGTGSYIHDIDGAKTTKGTMEPLPQDQAFPVLSNIQRMRTKEKFTQIM
jgi:hypothetical protein